MKSIKTLLVIAIICFSLESFSQNLDKKRPELKKHLFNYEKGRQYISMFPQFGMAIAPADNRFALLLGFSLGYGFFPIKNWSIEPNLTYVHSFNKPHFDYNDVILSIQNRYFFLPNYKRVSIYLGLNFTANMFQYKATSSDFLFYNDSLDNESHVHFIPTITPHAGISVKLGKIFTVPIGLGYNINFQPEGVKHYEALYMTLALNYNFGLLKDKKKQKKRRTNFINSK